MTSATVSVSFEFFPPGDEAAAGHLWSAIERLAPLGPKFVSVTYGADGSTRSRTHECVMRILRETDLTVAPHLTCVGAAREEVIGIAEDYWRQGVRHLVALRGDPATAGGYQPHPGGFAFGADLVRGLRGAAPVRDLRRRLSRRPSRNRDGRGRSRESQAQDRRRGEWRDHAVLLRHGRILAVSGSVRSRRHPREHRAGHPAHHAVSADAALCRALRHVGARVGCAGASTDSMRMRRRGG